MPSIIYRFAVLLCIAFCSLQSQAKTSVWQLTDGKNTVYIGGTVHLLSEKDHPLPAAYERAYKAADTLVFETDMAAMQTPAYQAQLMGALTNKDGRSLQSQLSPETLASLTQFFQSRGMDVAGFSMFTPSGVAMMISIIELQRMGLEPQWGVDVQYSARAERDNKTQAQLETPEQQIAFITAIGDDDPNATLNYTLADLNKMQSYMADMLRAWREGDMPLMEKLALVEMREKVPAMHKVLVLERNQRWLPQIKAMLADAQKNEFVLVGALHLAGPEGLIEQLRKSGYTVTQLD